MRRCLPLVAALLLAATAAAAPVPRGSCAALRRHLAALSALTDPAARARALDAAWDTLRARGAFPCVVGDSVLFLYRGPAATVAFPGDFNGWQPTPARAERLGGGDVWVQQEVFPADARLDYKIVVDGDRWLLDPENPRRQRGGFGDNSELRLPASVPSPWVAPRDDAPRGSLHDGRLASGALGYDVAYRVYAPAGYADLADLPVLYVTDGHEYADPTMGALVAVLDNLIAAGRVRPLLAVFIDPRVAGRNLRAEQYVLSDTFLACVRDELVPAVDAAWRTSRDRRDRGILGTSLGGLNAAWFAVRAPETFGRAAMQSPAFQAGDGAIVGLWEQAPRLDLDLFLSWGTYFDFGQASQRFRGVLDAKGYAYRQLVVHEGHSWGAWRAQLDDVLEAFWPAAPAD